MFVFFIYTFSDSAAVTLMVVSHVGGLLFTVCVMLQRGLGFREVVALQVPENHLDLKHTLERVY